LNTPDIIIRTAEYQTNWFHHLKRMGLSRETKIYQYTPKGRG